MAASSENGQEYQTDRRADYSAIWRRVNEEFACEHPDTVLTRYVKVNNTSEFRRQCARCGATAAVVKRTTIPLSVLDGIVPFDRDLPERWRQQWRARYDELKAEKDAEFAEAEAGRDGEWQAWYAAYLEGPEWLLKRRLVMERAGGKCEGCRQLRATQVHHLTYAHVGAEFLFELVALCRPCHQKIHDRET